jgi:two-component system nitrate/nitrite response regulator NarL
MRQDTFSAGLGSAVMIEVALIAPVRAYRDALAAAVAAVSDIELVYRAASGAEVISHLAPRQPSVALLDFNSGDAVTTIATLKTIAPSTQVVAFGVGSDPEQYDAVIRAAEQGVSGFVESDRPLDEIVEAIRLVARGLPACGPRIVSLLLQALQRGATTSASPRTPGRGAATPLTPRERLVAELAAHGLTNRQIASRLGLGESTVKTHMHAVLHKLGLSSRDELIVVPRIRPAAD